MSSILKGLQLNELSNKKLGDYKKAAGADATAADKAGDYKRGDKRMSGIIKATKKEFANDEKKKDVAEAGMPFRGVGGAFNRGDDERHDLDPTEWYVVKDGKMYKTSVYPNQVQQAISLGYSRSREEAKAKADRQGVAEGYHNSKTIITEALIAQKLWENAGHKLMEAQLTADQINQIFQQVEQGATAAGNNRTMLGRGKDAASAVNKAWEDLKTKVQNSGPIKGVDAMYDKAAEQLKQATGGDQGVMQYVQKYRDFAKKHPVAQSLIYSALIAAAGISGAGLGGAAALGLFKLVDKLLQGEKFSSAAYAGAKTGAMAYGASKVGDLVKGQMAAKADPSMTYKPDIMTPTAGQGAGQSVDMGGSFVSAAENPGVQRLANWAVKNFDMNTYDYVPKGMNVFVYDKAGNLVQSIASDPSMRKAGIYTGQQMLDVMKKSAGVNESINLSESQIFLMIGKIVERQRKLDEGIMDTIKGAAGSAVNWAKTKGTNLTTKVTADKLLQAWKKAGSPMDSLDVASVIQKAGIPSDTIKQVYGSMKIPFAGEPSGGAMPQSVKSTQQAAPAQQTTVPQVAPVAKAAAPVAKAAAATAPQGFNASNVMKMPGMEKYAKPAVAKPANFSGGPTGYASVNTTFKQPAVKPAKQPSMAEEQLDELSCWSGYHRVAGTKAGFPGSCAKNKTNEESVAEGIPADNDMGSTTGGAKMTLGQWKQMWMKKMPNADFAAMFRSPPNMRGSAIAYFDGWVNNPDARWDPQQGVTEEKCPHCNGPMFSEMIMNEKKDACYYKVKSRYKVWPSAYASGALVKCRKKGASNWGTGGKKNESSILEGIEQADESLHDWFNKEKWVRMDTKGKIKGPCAREPGEGKPKCLPQAKAHSLGKKGRASAAQRKRREDPNPERSGKAINVDTKKSKG